MTKPHGTRTKSSGNPSIAEVAEFANVSVATVSRVINNLEGVREKTRERVMDAVKVLGYQMNHLARNLRTAETRLLLTMVPDVGNPFYAQIVRGIDSVARQSGYFVLLCDTYAEEGRERSYFDLLRSHRADGAICLDPDTVQHALANEAADLPWVACCEFDPEVAVPYVGIDNAKAAGEAVQHLIGKGHRRIGFVNSDLRYLYARERERGYREALQAAGITVDPAMILNVEGLDYADGTDAALRLLDMPEPPTAIFAVSDTLAIGVLSALRRLGKRVPDEMAVIGFDNIAISASIDPPLTTVAQPMRQLGETAARLLLQRLANPEAEVSGVVLPHQLILRETA